MTTKRSAMIATTTNRKGESHHFFASSLGRWHTSCDLQSLIATMKRDGLPFNVFLVPGDLATEYGIEYFAPVKEGTIWLAFYGPEQKDAAK